jgi:hypothetical protein
VVRQAGQRTHKNQRRALSAQPIVGENSIGMRLACRTFQAATRRLASSRICASPKEWQTNPVKEIRDAKEYFDVIPNVELEPDMLAVVPARSYRVGSGTTRFDPGGAGRELWGSFGASRSKPLAEGSCGVCVLWHFRLARPCSLSLGVRAPEAARGE